jgi:hypothetical protein
MVFCSSIQNTSKMIRISIRITNRKKAFSYLLLCFFCSQDKSKMFALKSVKKNPELHTYALTEKKILEKISHVSYWTVSSVRKPVDLIRILPEASNIFIWNCSRLGFYCWKHQAASTPTELSVGKVNQNWYSSLYSVTDCTLFICVGSSCIDTT